MITSKKDVVHEQISRLFNKRIVKTDNRGRGVKFWITRIKPSEFNTLYTFSHLLQLDIEITGSSEGAVLFITTGRINK